MSHSHSPIMMTTVPRPIKREASSTTDLRLGLQPVGKVGHSTVRVLGSGRSDLAPGVSHLVCVTWYLVYGIWYRVLDLKIGRILVLKGISKVRFLLPLNFKRISKILTIKPLTLKGFHKKSFEFQRFFKGYVICDLLFISLKKKRHK